MTIQTSQVLVNLGCGLQSPSGWINVDASWSARIAKLPRLKRVLKILRVLPRSTIGVELEWSPNIVIVNLARPLPFFTGAVDVVYSSHTLEHLYVEDAKLLIKEIYRILKVDGICRIVVPDGQYCVRKGVISELTETDYSERVPRISAEAKRIINAGMDSSSEPMLRRLLHQINDIHSHKYLYTEASLIALLRWAGFGTVTHRSAFESKISQIHNIELSSRSSDGSLCVEAIR